MKKIIFIEGLWGTGKSKICRHLKNKFGFFYIKEPKHIKEGLNNKKIEYITFWYLKKHIENFKDGLKLIKSGFNVVVERGPVSSIAFIKTGLKNKNSFKKDILYFEKLLKQCYNKPYVIYIEPIDINKISKSVKKRLYISNYATPSFLESLNKNFLEYLNKLSRKGLIKLIKFKSI